jgi:hypothetical protein
MTEPLPTTAGVGRLPRKPWYTVTELAAFWGVCRRQALRRLIEGGVVKPGGRGKKVRVPLKRLVFAFGEEFESLALADPSWT